MKVITGEDRTERLIEICAKDPKSIIMVASFKRAREVAALAKAMGLEIPYPLVPLERKATQYSVLLVDDMMDVFATMYGYPPDVWTMA